MKMQNIMKMTDQVAGHENGGPSKSQGVKCRTWKCMTWKWWTRK